MQENKEGVASMTNASQQTGDGKPLPLAGIRVVDLGWVISVPLIGRFLADLGAEVIKVESRSRLDLMRREPPLGDRQAGPDWAVSFHGLHRNKLSITLDLRSQEARALVKRLIAVSDVVMENMTPGAMERLGLGYEELRKIRPDIVMLSVSNIGQRGPLSNTSAFCPCSGAVSGFSTLVGYEGEETLLSGAFLDPTTALYGVFALLTALEHRAQTGEGQYVDAALVEAGVSLTAEPLLDYQWNGRVWGPRGNVEPGFAPHNTYPCREPDSWIAIAVTSDSEWGRLLEVMGHPAWAQDPRFADQLSRWKHRADLDVLVSQWTAPQDRDDLVGRLQATGVAASASYRQPELPSQELYQHRQDYVVVDHPTFPGEMLSGVPWKLSETPGSIRRHAPLLGEHNAQVFGDLLGLSEEELQRLEEAGVLT